MSLNIKILGNPIIVFVVILSLYITYILQSREIPYNTLIGENIKYNFSKNITTLYGVDFTITLADESNAPFSGQIEVRTKNKSIYKKKFSKKNLEQNVYINSLFQAKNTYLLIPKNILQQNATYTIIINFQKKSSNISSIYLNFYKSNLGGYFHQLGLDFLRVRL